MTTPDTHRVELDPLVLSFDDRVVESDEDRGAETDVRELSAYGFDSDEQTLAGIGSSDSPESSPVRPFDSSDRTLVGIGPLDRDQPDESVEPDELREPAEPSVILADSVVLADSVAMPPSEPPGPFVTADEVEAPLRLPMRKGVPWLFALPVVLAPAAAVAVWRGVVPHAMVPHTHSAAILAPLDAVPRAAPAVESPTTPPLEVLARMAPPAPTSLEKLPERMPRHVTAKSASAESGSLDVTSSPPSSLILDGRPLGRTPRVVQLPSGPHTVLFVHPERGRMSVTVNVRPGRTSTASANF